MAYDCKVVADSMAPCGVRLTSLEVTYPRFVHSEFMTHRMFSRNAASSRAIPVKKMLERVKTDPVLPVWWGANQAGMQANDELQPESICRARQDWLEGRDKAVETVESLMLVGLHKQIANRVLEPWMWITVLVTATDWDNFFALRLHRAAQPELRHAAGLMQQAMDSSAPKQLKAGEWHLPYVQNDEGLSGTLAIEVCVGRCARLSYLTHTGTRDPKADRGLHDTLLQSGHMSPFEHAAMALDQNIRFGNFRGWRQYRKTILGEDNFARLQG
jgi:thymidylate synthase ThyX